MKKFKNLEWLGTLHYVHYGIIICSLILTLFAAYYSNKLHIDKQKAKFDKEADQVVDLFVDRMEKYEEALASAASFFKTVEGPSYLEWKKYATDLRIEEKYPGINGIGFIKSLKSKDIAKFEKEENNTHPNFKIYPKHNRETSFPIVYIEPEKINIQAVGLDMGWEDNRFNAAKESRDLGVPRITKPITLVQDSEKTPGFLFYLPMYRGKSTTSTSKIDFNKISENKKTLLVLFMLHLL